MEARTLSAHWLHSVREPTKASSHLTLTSVGPPHTSPHLETHTQMCTCPHSHICVHAHARTHTTQHRCALAGVLCYTLAHGSGSIEHMQHCLACDFWYALCLSRGRRDLASVPRVVPGNVSQPGEKGLRMYGQRLHRRTSQFFYVIPTLLLHLTSHDLRRPLPSLSANNAPTSRHRDT